ncbi:hypothetical protein BDW60DRAFT_201921, partial [Aspergillus nidulans var. acristatus]
MKRGGLRCFLELLILMLTWQCLSGIGVLHKIMKPDSAHAWLATVLISAIHGQMRRDA